MATNKTRSKKPAAPNRPAPAKLPTPDKASKASKSKEVDPDKLDPADARKRCRMIYRLEKKIETKRIAHDQSKRNTAAAKKALDGALEELRKEISEQRFGPGPLFDDESK